MVRGDLNMYASVWQLEGVFGVASFLVSISVSESKTYYTFVCTVNY